MKKVLILLLCLFTTESFATGIGNVATALCDNDTLNKYTGTANVEINWEPNIIQLGWYDGNTKLDVPSSAQSCTYDGVVTVPPQPTKPGYTFNGWKVMGVPSGYTRLDYIEGGQNLNAYINLGFPATPTMQTLLTASIGMNGDGVTQYGQQIIFGASNAKFFANAKPYAIDRHPNATYIPNGDYGSNISALENIPSLNTIYQFKINYPTVGIIGFDDITKTGFTNVTSVSQQNLYLFGYNAGGTYSTDFSVLEMKLYALTMWDNNQIIHNYIPAKNPSNVIGIYDTVTGTFLTNAGSGAFVAGPVVQ